MGYDIYDTDSGNLWASFPTEQEALAEVSRAIVANGKDAVASWALGQGDHTGTALAGEDLVLRALRSVAIPPR